jgi:hypothetical protein
MSDKSKPVDVSVVPTHLGDRAFLVWEQKGDWAIGQTANAGKYDDDLGDWMFPPSLAQMRLTWMGSGEFYGRAVPFDDNVSEADLSVALWMIQPFDAERVSALARGQVRRRVRKKGRFCLNDLRELISFGLIAEGK